MGAAILICLTSVRERGTGLPTLAEVRSGAVPENWQDLSRGFIEMLITAMLTDVRRETRRFSNSTEDWRSLFEILFLAAAIVAAEER